MIDLDKELRRAQAEEDPESARRKLNRLAESSPRPGAKDVDLALVSAGLVLTQLHTLRKLDPWECPEHNPVAAGVMLHAAVLTENRRDALSDGGSEVSYSSATLLDTDQNKGFLKHLGVELEEGIGSLFDGFSHPLTGYANEVDSEQSKLSEIGIVQWANAGVTPVGGLDALSAHFNLGEDWIDVGALFKPISFFDSRYHVMHHFVNPDDDVTKY